MPSLRASSAFAVALLILSACKGGTEVCDPTDPLCSTGGTPPTMTIAGVTVTEGTGGTVNAVFPVTLSAAASSTVTVQYATSSGTATVAADFEDTSGTLTIAAGVTAGQVTVPVISDFIGESGESFTVTLTSPTNATLAGASATGTITDDDACTPSGTIAPGETVSDALEATDCLWTTATDYIDMWVLTVPDTAWLAIDLTSQRLDFDPYAALFELDSASNVQDDNGGYDVNSRQVILVPAGTFVIYAAASTSAGETGDYDLTVTEVPVDAQFYGSSQSGGGASSLYSIAVDDGTPALIGAMGFNRVGAMSFHPTTDVLYAIGDRIADGIQVLITVNPTTGVGTEVGPTGNSGGVADLDFHSDGTLFVYTSGHELYTANLTTGAATLVGLTGNPPSGGNGIAFDAANVLYHANRVESHTLNTGTGVASYLADMNFPSPCVDIAANARVSGAARPDGMSEFYGILKCEGGAAEAYLAQVDFSTGRVFIIAQSQDYLDGFAILD